ncbi:MAG: hypothetical protein LUQ40_03915 [Methanomicrobiales archaeon]|nr:hypothetical protein [Methanomicrobiales archaeon]
MDFEKDDDVLAQDTPEDIAENQQKCAEQRSARPLPGIHCKRIRPLVRRGRKPSHLQQQGEQGDRECAQNVIVMTAGVMNKRNERESPIFRISGM